MPIPRMADILNNYKQIINNILKVGRTKGLLERNPVIQNLGHREARQGLIKKYKF
uniref:Uncharacterized protein n=1 Tax=Rhizophora mucronata TaxID=61149 RepID=A0A2P2J2E6_RHIMU